MKKIKTLLVKFDNRISNLDIPKFRGAVIGKMENPDVIFHHHLDDDKYLKAYPLIQYKTINQHAAFFCIEEGTSKIHEFLKLDNWDMRIGETQHQIKLDSIKANEYLIQAWDKYFHYRISNWLPLNKENYQAYQNATGSDEKLFILEKVLRGNILSMGKGVDCHFDKEVKVNIETIVREKTQQFKEIKLHAIDAVFRTNVFLPNYMGLGKGVSIGFGVVNSVKLPS